MARVILEINRLGAHGDGLAVFQDQPVAVPFTLDGETVEADIAPGPHGLAGQLLRIMEASPQRQAPPCPHFGVDAPGGACGGCVIQHAAPAHYQEWKRDKVRHILARAGITHACDSIFTTPPCSRRRAVFSAVRANRKTLLGFNKRASHELVDIHSCTVLRPAITALLPSLRAALHDVLHDGQALDIQVTEVDDVLSVVLAGAAFTPAQENTLVAWALAQKIGMLHVRSGEDGARLLLKQAYLRARYGTHEVLLPPAPFLQASLEAERAMLDFVAPHLACAKSFADLFCGNGLFALSFAKDVTRILAADADEVALAALHDAARDLPQLKTQKRNLFSDPYPTHDLNRFDAVILDPPRAGAAAQMKLLAHAKVPRIISVSCNPVSFARDAGELVKGGYHLIDLKLFDQFLWSAHVELIGVFAR